MKKETSKPANRKAQKKNGKSRYTHAVYHRADGTTRTVTFQQAEKPAAKAKTPKPAAKAAKPAKKAKRTVSSK